jgi:hypothetical protein
VIRFNENVSPLVNIRAEGYVLVIHRLCKVLERRDIADALGIPSDERNGNNIKKQST